MRKNISAIVLVTLINVLVSIYIYEHLISYAWNPDKSCLAGQVNYKKNLSNSILWNWLI